MSVTGFDSERYLRALAQRTLSASEGGIDTSTPVLAAAQALVAVGCVDERVAQRVLDDDEKQRRRLDPDRAVGWTREWPRAPFTHRRVALGGGEVVHPAGTIRVRYVVFAPETTKIAVTIRRPWRPRFPLSLRVPFGTGVGAAARIAGDRGEPVPAGFSGSGSSTQWHGVLHTLDPLDDATRSIEIDGLRVQLESVSPCAEVHVEALPDQDPAMRHLWQRTVLADVFYDRFLDTAISALIAAGAVTPDEPQLTTMRAVAAALGLDGRQRRKAIAALPEPWASLWRRREFEGPTRTIAVDAVTPVFDGVVVVVDALESSPQQWSIATEFAPEGASPRPFEAPTARMASLVWWAQDDRGNRYLAGANGVGGNAQNGRGEVTFGAPLDPHAHWIELHPTTETSRAVLRIPLV